MRFVCDRFLIAVVVITAVVILGMFILHKGIERKIQCDIALKRAPTISTQNEVKSSSIVVQSLPLKGPFRVSCVLDGDTILLDNGETVRLIGVDAPEIHHPELPVQRFGKEAMQFLKRLVEGLECTLEYEPNNLRDQYGRLLAYVFVDGRLANAEIIQRGYAYAYTRFPFRRQAEFIALEHEAQKHQYGLWHLSLKDGRIANLVKRYESLNIEGRKRLDEILKELVQKYPFEQKK
ncbi:MAG: thermonuclease family protein [bacterium]